jgi:hypothetical protein
MWDAPFEMTKWNEDNFLEKITPLLGRRAGPALCLEVSALAAVADGQGRKTSRNRRTQRLTEKRTFGEENSQCGPLFHEISRAAGPPKQASEIVKKAIAAHTLGCPSCTDLQQHLRRFDAAGVADHDAEWEQTEKRLDNWLQSVLASDTAVHHEGARTRSSRLRPWWKSITNPIIVRRFRWVLVPAGALALVICSFLVGRVSVLRSPQVSSEVMSLKRLPANVAPPSAVIEQRASETKPSGKSQLSQSPRTQPKPGEDSAIASRAHGRIRSLPAASPAAPHESARATGTTVPSPVPPGNSEVASISSPLEPPQNPTGSSAPDAGGGRTVETAETSATAHSIGQPAPRPLSAKRATPPGMASLVASRGVAPAPEERAELLPTIPAPAVIAFDAGTRVWIALKAIRPQVDGVSDFRGAVLLPVTQSGAVLLGRNVEVSGTVTVRNGKRSVQILEFVSTGVHYRLRSASGEANLRLLGAGEAVEFDAGRVLETWMASASVYERVPGDSRLPRK